MSFVTIIIVPIYNLLLSCNGVILSTYKGGQINFSVIRSWT